MKLLSSSLLIARLRGMEIRLHISMLLNLPIAYYIFQPVTGQDYILALCWLLGFTLSILLHELGHALTARFLGVDVHNIVIWVLGGFTTLNHKVQKPTHELAISAAGPLVNLLLAFLWVLAYIAIHFIPAAYRLDWFDWLQPASMLCFLLAVFNLIIAVFNLLPLYPLDGGSILRALLEMAFGKTRADLITLIIGIPLLLGVFAFGIFLGDYLLVFSTVLIALGLAALKRSLLGKINLALNYFFKRGGYYFLLGDFDRAIQTFTAEIDREPDQPAHYVARAACLLNLMQTERAKADVERALRLAPQNLLALQLRGELYMLEKDYDRALDFFERALQINRHWGLAYFDRGSVYMDRKDFPAARAEFNHAIRLMPGHFIFHLIRSVVHFRLGDMAAARNDQDAALRLDPKNALVMAEYNLIIYEDYLDWAEDYYARAIASADTGYAHWGRGDAYRVNKLYDEAILDYSRAIELMPHEAGLYLARGKAWKALAEIEKAKADFASAIAKTDKSHLKRQAHELLKNL